jgi:hypothetical protein
MIADMLHALSAAPSSKGGKRRFVVMLLVMIIGLTILSSVERPPSDVAMAHIDRKDDIFLHEANVIDGLSENATTSSSDDSCPGQRLLLMRSIDTYPIITLTDQVEAVKAVLRLEAVDFQTQRHWVINRQPLSRLNALTKLLKEHGESYTILPFEGDYYARVPHTYRYISSDDEAWHNGTNINPIVDESARHDKILYAVNQNGVRNWMIDLGQSEAFEGVHWILPTSADTLWTTSSQSALCTALQQVTQRKSSHSHHYVVAPVYEVSELDGPRRRTPSDPVVVFSSKAKGRYHPHLRYGRFATLELLSRLGVDLGKESDLLEWERFMLQRTRQDEGRVAPPTDHRLAQQGPPLDQGGVVKVVPDAWLARWTSPKAVQLGLASWIDYWDLQTSRNVYDYRPKQYLHTDAEMLAYERRLYQSAVKRQPKHWRDDRVRALVQTMGSLVETAEYYRRDAGPWLVTDRPPPTNSGLSARQYTSAHADDWHALVHNTTVWALASFVTGSEDYGRYAVKQLKEWFWSGDSVLPRLQEPSDLVDWFDLVFLVDTFRLLQEGSFFAPRQEEMLIKWTKDFSLWLQQRVTADWRDNIYFDGIVATLAYWHKDDILAYRHLMSTGRHLPALMDLVEKDPCSESARQELHAWHVVARLSQVMGLRLWNHRYLSLDWAATTGDQFRIPNDPLYGSDWPVQSTLCDATTLVVEGCPILPRWLPLVDGHRRFCPLDTTARPEVPPTRYHMPAKYPDNSGIAPYWNLGYRRYVD